MNMNTDEQAKIHLLSDTVKAQIDHWLSKYPEDQRQSALLPSLLLTQEANGGWLNDDLVVAVAAYLKISPVTAFEAYTFYSMYEREPVGRHKIYVCTNLSCMLRGSEQIVAHLENRLGIKTGQTTSDGKFTLKAVECLAACGNAPAMQIDNKDYHEDLTPAKVDQILANLE